MVLTEIRRKHNPNFRGPRFHLIILDSWVLGPTSLRVLDPTLDSQILVSGASPRSQVFGIALFQTFKLSNIFSLIFKELLCRTQSFFKALVDIE